VAPERKEVDVEPDKTLSEIFDDITAAWDNFEQAVREAYGHE
jgi:hypothetical protein